MQKKSGFTLIELSIVLVIIGLVVGGVLAGKDMIRAAEIRSAVSQIEKYNTAVYTFRNKYNYLPGDIPAQIASEVGMTTRIGGVGHGDGNGLLEGCFAGATIIGCETAMFWTDLSTANMLDTNFSRALDFEMELSHWFQQRSDMLIATVKYLSPVREAYAMAMSSAPTPKDEVLPKSRLGRGNYITVFTASGRNFYQIAGVVSADTLGNYALQNMMTPLEAYSIDNKIDNGMPLSGRITAVGGTTALNVAAVPGAANCVFTGGTSYNTRSTDIANSPLCQLKVQMN